MHKNNLPVFVATNEQDAANLSILHNAGYLTSANIISTLLAQFNVSLHLDSIFAVELILMCQADTFLFWGESLANYMVEHYRRSASSHAIKPSDKGSRIISDGGGINSNVAGKHKGDKSKAEKE